MSDRHQFLGIWYSVGLFTKSIKFFDANTSNSISDLSSIEKELSKIEKPIIAIEYLESLGWELVNAYALGQFGILHYIFRKKIG